MPLLPLQTTQVGGMVTLDEMVVLPGELGVGNGGPRDLTRESKAWRAAVLGRLGKTMKTTHRIQQHQFHHMADLRKKIVALQKQVTKLQYMQSVPRTSRQLTTSRGVEIVEGVPAPPVKPATLCDRPKLLATLWEEWIKGVGGRLPAKDFAPHQRGKVEALFHLRKPFWLCIERLIHNGYDAASAIDLIEEHYSDCDTMTKKLAKISRHEKLGGHYRLCPNGQGVNPNLQ